MKKENEKIIAIYNNLSLEEKRLFDKNKYIYIYTKSDLYLKIGSKKYRQNDYFQMPNHTLVDDDLMLIADGCKQILEGIGLTPRKPFLNLGIIGFNRLFELFHFEVLKVETKTTPKGYLDKMILKHLVNDDIVEYYNLV